MRGSVEFIPGEPFHYEVFTPAGWLTVTADVQLASNGLVLDDLSIWPLHTKQLTLSSGLLFRIRTRLVREAKLQGYTSLEVRGFRLSGRNARRSFVYHWSWI